MTNLRFSRIVPFSILIHIFVFREDDVHEQDKENRKHGADQSACKQYFWMTEREILKQIEGEMESQHCSNDIIDIAVESKRLERRN